MWSPLLQEAILHAPQNSIKRWPLCSRDPHPRWTSTGGRVVPLGDSAHGFLPTWGNGAVQSLEDAVSHAECLRLAGKGNEGIATRDVHREADLEMPPNRLMVQGKWLWDHNPEKYMTEIFARARAHLEDGSPFENNQPASWLRLERTDHGE
ncbi:hypothetical protein F5B19DRAFT_502411 [Rostrohypoxylon terebratum]|nr:hypothetical protein F5B19DRAFT_502411 [Rostrohypoxylon terebratum]